MSRKAFHNYWVLTDWLSSIPESESSSEEYIVLHKKLRATSKKIVPLGRYPTLIIIKWNNKLNKMLF